MIARPSRLPLAALFFLATACENAKSPAKESAVSASATAIRVDVVTAPPLDVAVAQVSAAASGSGEIPPPRVSVTDASIRKAVGRCYSSALQRDPTLAGKVTFALTVDPDGFVTRAEVVGTPSLADPPGIACMLDALRRFRITPSSSEDPVIKIPFTFVSAP